MSTETETTVTTTTTTPAAAVMQPAEVEAKTATDAESLVESESTPKTVGKIWTRNKKVLVMAFFFVVLCAVVLVAYELWAQADAQESPQDTAFLTLQQLMEDGYDDDDRAAFDTAFDTFDANNDDVLNEAEFSEFFTREMSYSAEFERMDVDGDDVLSYPETVAYVQQMGEIEPMKDYVIESLSGVIAAEFDFEMTVDDDEDSLALFLEYVAVVAYFGMYDADVNGYVHRDEFVSISAQNEFAAYAYADADEENGGITREAFFDILYGDDEYSWDGALHEMYGEHSEETVSAWAAVEISTDMVRDVDIKLNPMQILRDAERAQQADQADPDAKMSPGYKGVRGRMIPGFPTLPDCKGGCYASKRRLQLGWNPDRRYRPAFFYQY